MKYFLIIAMAIMMASTMILMKSEPKPQFQFMNE